MEDRNALIEHDSRLFLFKALAQLQEQDGVSTERIDEINQGIAAIANKLSITKAIDITQFSELKTIAKDAVLRLNLGLEYGSHEDLGRAVHLLVHNEVIRFYQIGNTLMTKLRREAEDIKQRAELTVAESGMVQMASHPETVMRIPLLNKRETAFLNTLIAESLTLDEVGTVIETTQEKQPIEHLRQVEIAEGMLRNLTFRLDYLETLPFHLMAKETDFRYARHLENSVDLGGKITCGLIVNLVVDSGKHFCVTLDTVRQFRQRYVIPDEESEAIEEMSLKWLIEYLETHQAKPEVIDYAYDYWMYWLKRLDGFLQSPIERRKELEGWFIL